MKLIRTTYWTRKITDKRPDETDDFRQEKSDNIDQTHALDSMANSEAKINNEPEVKSDEKESNRMLDIFLNVICGLEAEKVGVSDEEANENTKAAAEKQAKQESMRRVQTFYSLNQSKLERYVLNINLVIIIVIAIGLYTFYSIPPEYHIFKGVPINYDLNSTNIS